LFSHLFEKSGKTGPVPSEGVEEAPSIVTVLRRQGTFQFQEVRGREGGKDGGGGGGETQQPRRSQDDRMRRRRRRGVEMSGAASVGGGGGGGGGGGEGHGRQAGGGFGGGRRGDGLGVGVEEEGGEFLGELLAVDAGFFRAGKGTKFLQADTQPEVPGGVEGGRGLL